MSLHLSALSVVFFILAVLAFKPDDITHIAATALLVLMGVGIIILGIVSRENDLIF